MGDDEILVKRRMSRALLYYLATQSSMSNRADIILKFWPEESETNGKRRLRENLSKLRNQLPDPDCILVDKNQIGLDHEMIYSDVIEFERICDQTIRLADNYSRQSPLPNSIYQQILKAVNLWRTPKILDGESIPNNEGFENWFFEMSNRLELLYLDLLTRLADHYAALGDFPNAVRYIKNVLRVDIFDQDANLKLLTWLKDLEHIKEARAHCNYLNEIAEKDTGFYISEEILKICEDIKCKYEIPNSKIKTWPAPFSIMVPYVGNHELLKNIDQNYSQGGATFIFGEAGVGKTRLIYEIYHKLHPSPRLFYARSHHSEQMLPYQTIIEMVRRSVFKDEWAVLDPVWIGQLAPLFPELYTIISDIHVNRQWVENSQPQILEAFHQLFKIISKNGKNLMILDDGQWSDDGTLSVYKYLIERKFFDDNGLLLVSVREEQNNFVIEKFIRNITHQQNLHRYYLELLKRDDVSKLVEHVLGRLPSESLLDKIMIDTGGSPLFILEMLRATMEELPSHLIPEAFDKLHTPQSIHSMVRERLWNIDSSVWKVLSTAALIGNRFTPLLVEQATGMASEDVVSALETLERGHLLQSCDEGGMPGHYNFIHNKIREIIVMDLSQARKRMIHQNIAAAYEKRPGKEKNLAGIIAYHYTEAYLISDAFKYWLLAGQYSNHLFSLEEANNAFRKAEELLVHFPAYIDDENVYLLYSYWGEIARDSLDLDLMKQIYHTVLGLGEERSNKRLVGCAYTGLGLHAMLTDNDIGGMEYANRALEYLPQTEVYEIAKTYNLFGMLYTYQNKLNKAKDSYKQALKLSDRKLVFNRLERTLAETKHRLSLIYIFSGYPKKAIKIAQEALDTKSKIMYQAGMLRASYVLGMSNYFAGQYDLAYAQCEPAVQIATKMQKWYTLGLSLQVLTSIYLIRGDVDKAIAHIKQIEQIANKYGYKSMLVDANLLWGDFYRLMRDYDQAVNYYRSYEERTDHPFRHLFYKVRYAGTQHYSGNTQEGLPLLNCGIEEAKKTGMGTVYLLGETIKNIGDFYNGRIYGLEGSVNTIRRLTKNRSLETTSISSLWLQAEIDYIHGDFDNAKIKANELIEQAKQMPHFWILLRGNILLHKISVVKQSGNNIYYNSVIDLLGQLENKCKKIECEQISSRYKEKVIKSLV